MTAWLVVLWILVLPARAADVDHDDLRFWVEGGEPMELVTDQAVVADGLVLREGPVTATATRGYLFPVVSGRTDEAWRKLEAKRAGWEDPLPPEGYRPPPRPVGWVFVGEGTVELAFPVPHYAWEFANHLVADVGRPKDELRAVAHDGAPWRTTWQAGVVLGADPALADEVAARDFVGPSTPGKDALGKVAAVVVPDKAAFAAAQATARRLWSSRPHDPFAGWVATDRMRLEKLHEPASSARLFADLLTGTAYGWVGTGKVDAEYDRWLQVVRDPNGWYRADAVVEVSTIGEHPSEGWKGRDLSLLRQPPVDPTDPLSPPLPPLRPMATTLDRTVTVDKTPEGLHLLADVTQRMTIRAVGGPLQTFVLSIPAEKALEDKYRLVALTTDDGRRVTVEDPEDEDFAKRSGPMLVVLPEPLAEGAQITLKLVTHDSFPFANVDHVAASTFAIGSLGESTGLMMLDPELKPSFEADWVVTQRVGVPQALGLQVSLSGKTLRQWTEGTLAWEEAKTDGRGVYVGLAVGKWIERTEPAAAGMPPVRVHLAESQATTIDSFPGEIRRILTTYQGYLPAFPWQEIELFQAPDAVNYYVWIAPHGMVNLQVTRLLSSGAGNPFREGTPHMESGVLAHELAHQWWGHHLRAAHISEGWVNETFSETFSCQYVARAYGTGDLDARMQKYRSLWEDEIPDKDARAPLPRAYESWLQPQIVYDYGPYVMHRMLRRRLGDEAFFGVLDVFQRDHAKRFVSSEQLLATFQAGTKEDLSDFFRFWIWQGWLPGVELAWHEDGERVVGTVTGDVPFGTFDVPVRLTAKDGSTRDVWLDVVDGTGTFTSDPTPGGWKKVELDPDGAILAKWRRVRKDR